MPQGLRQTAAQVNAPRPTTNLLYQRNWIFQPFFLTGAMMGCFYPDIVVGRAPHGAAAALSRSQPLAAGPVPGAARGSGCYGLRFASVLRTASGLRPEAPSASLTLR